MLYQNDDFGKDYVLGMRDVLGAKFDGHGQAPSYEVTDPTIDSQIISLQAAGAMCWSSAASPKFAAQAIRKVFEHRLEADACSSATSRVSVAVVMEPAGPEKAVGIDHLRLPQGPDRPGLEAMITA